MLTTATGSWAAWPPPTVTGSQAGAGTSEKRGYCTELQVGL